jgi:hypothetical protein
MRDSPITSDRSQDFLIAVGFVEATAMADRMPESNSLRQQAVIR